MLAFLVRLRFRKYHKVVRRRREGNRRTHQQGSSEREVLQKHESEKGLDLEWWEDSVAQESSSVFEIVLYQRLSTTALTANKIVYRCIDIKDNVKHRRNFELKTGPGNSSCKGVSLCIVSPLGMTWNMTASRPPTLEELEAIRCKLIQQLKEVHLIFGLKRNCTELRTGRAALKTIDQAIKNLRNESAA